MGELTGTTLGQYQILDLIGRGGMAQVYKAYQTALDRHVALKAISTCAENVRDDDLVARFNTEARLVGHLAHPNIVPVHDFGEERGWAYIVMEYLPGGTVRDRLAQAEATYARLALPWVLSMMEQAARALDFAHQSGVVHRDVKPGNMLLRSDEQLLLSDFGIATILAGSIAQHGHANVGTPQYMAPEQGSPNGTVDGRTDIYALGIVLFQCVTGRLPFIADTPIGTIMRHVNDPLPRPAALVPGLSPGVEQIIVRATMKNPAQRYQQAGEMAAALRLAREGLRREVRPAAPTRPMDGPASAPQGNIARAHVPDGHPATPGICLRCGFANDSRNRFCTNCGYDLSGRRALADRVPGRNGQPLRCRIVFRSGPLTGRAFVLHQDTTTLGRTGGNDIVIPDGTVSRNHARMRFMDGSWQLDDVRSANGTFVNGARVSAPVTLRHGDELRFGDDLVRFEVLG